MTTEEKLQRMQDEIDYLRRRIEVLEGRCTCPTYKKRYPWEFDDPQAPWWGKVWC